MLGHAGRHCLAGSEFPRAGWCKWVFRWYIVTLLHPCRTLDGWHETMLWSVIYPMHQVAAWYACVELTSARRAYCFVTWYLVTCIMETMQVSPSSSASSQCTCCCQQRHTRSKTSLQLNRSVVNGGCQLTPLDLYDVREAAVVPLYLVFLLVVIHVWDVMCKCFTLYKI